jgi:hypothetical protein
MANIFHKKEQGRRPRNTRNNRPQTNKVPAQRKVSDHDLVDPVVYVGDLDPIKYPVLEQKKTETQEFEPENPLNKRRQ